MVSVDIAFIVVGEVHHSELTTTAVRKNNKSQIAVIKVVSW